MSQSKRLDEVCFVQTFLLRLVLLDDFFQQVDVTGEGFSAAGRQRTGR